MKKRKISPEETKKRLIEAGLHLIGMKGFEATRTRELAERAGVNQAAIPYHFGGKEGLYLAVAKYVVERGQLDLKSAVELVSGRLQQGDLTREEAGNLYIQFLHAFIDKIVMADDISDRSRFVMREYTTPGAGFDIIYEGMLLRLHQLQCSLVGIIRSEDPESEEVILRAHAIFGTILSNVIARRLLFKRLGWDGYDAERIKKIKNTIAEIVSHGLGLDAMASDSEAL